MEFQGVNILSDSGFCSDLFAIFYQHLRECSSCASFFLFYLILFVLLVFVFCLLYYLICTGLEKLIDSKHYKKKLDDLIPDYFALQEAHSNLVISYNQLEHDYNELNQEYYHTCN